ncbi:hypothetical protein NC653_039642 [Populus alba x Populus x berolinensis]|uniref:Uncharacterized protein n=1 Tax=Populus alba x Populus x berolinensis TaxID=444605 RepID=A0AAD6LBW0_9ROSI|nr:hypothetical protein NC653_039642 [Populus alba x Populus x berolinensis]
MAPPSMAETQLFSESCTSTQPSQASTAASSSAPVAIADSQPLNHQEQLLAAAAIQDGDKSRLCTSSSSHSSIPLPHRQQWLCFLLCTRSKNQQRRANNSSNMTAGYPPGPPSSVSTSTRGTRRQGEGEDTRRRSDEHRQWRAKKPDRKQTSACVSNSRMQPATVPNRVTDLDQ